MPRSLVTIIKKVINEAANRSLGRMFTHQHGRNIGAISADKGADRKTNKGNRARLEADLRARKLGYVPNKGVYRGGHEHSYTVMGRKGDDGGELKRHLTELGTKYGQESIIHKAHDSPDAHLHYTTGDRAGQHDSIGHWHPQVGLRKKPPDNMTQLKGKRSFSYE